VCRFCEEEPIVSCPGCNSSVASSMKNEILCRVCDGTQDTGCSDASRIPTFSCGQCDEDHPEVAAYSCTSCNMLLCSFHYEAHMRTKGTNSHAVVALSDVVSVSRSRDSADDRCVYHPTQRVESCCEGCNEPLCGRCDPQPHLKTCGRVVRTADSLPSLRRQLAAECSRLTGITQGLVQSVSRVEAIEGQFAASMKGKHARLEAEFQDLETCIAQAKSAAFQQFDASVNRSSQVLSGQLGAMQRRLAQLAATARGCSKLASDGGYVSVVNALQWSEQYKLHECDVITESLHVDAAVAVDALRPLIHKSWAVVSSGDARDTVIFKYRWVL
jgi:hypothetical protein